MKTLIILPDGTEISSGPGLANTIRATTITESVNRGTELTIGSTCSAMFEATLLTPGGALDVTSGDEISVFSVDDSGDRHPEGVFILERPTRATENTLKITGFDRISKLDKDLTAWLSSLDGWPYPLLTFAEMVCNACGVNLITESVPNSGFLVQRITQQLTGRKLMEWIGEICVCFCRATPTGDVELSWYKFNDIEIGPSGKNYYFLNGLSFEDYSVAPVDAVQLRLSSTEDGALFPEVADRSNSYVITGNQLLLSAVNTDLLPVLDVILDNLRTASYTPCKISVPASLEVRAGDVVKVTNLKGREIYTAVMTTVKKGNKRSLESTGSARRDSSTAANNKSVGEIAGQKANEAVDTLNQKEILRKLSNDWAEDGIYLTDGGKLALNATAIQSGILQSKDGQTFYLDLNNGILNMNATSLNIAGKTVDDIAQSKVDAQTQTDIFNKLTNNGAIPGLFMKNGQLYINASYLSTGVIASEDGTVKIDLQNNSISVDSTDSMKRKVQISSGDITGWGVDLETGEMYRALTIAMGYKQTGSIALTTISGAGGGLAITAGPADGLLSIGSVNSGHVSINGKSVKIKPGKTTLFTGTVSQNGTASVSNTADYDLFAVYLGDGTTVEGTAVLCYKTGSNVRGIGGRAGTSSTYRQLHFFEATISGNTWTVKDAKKQSVYDGSLASSESMKLMKVVGVI